VLSKALLPSPLMGEPVGELQEQAPEAKLQTFLPAGSPRAGMAVRLREIGCLQRSLDNQRSPWPGLTRPSTSSWTLMISVPEDVDGRVKPGHGDLKLYCGSRHSILHCRNC
jgi:hypothetical protein